MYIPSNVSANDFFKYHCTDENAVEYYDTAVKSHEATESDNIQLRNENESVREQLYFATELITQLETMLEKAKTLKEFKKDFLRAIEDSYLER